MKLYHDKSRTGYTKRNAKVVNKQSEELEFGKSSTTQELVEKTADESKPSSHTEVREYHGSELYTRDGVIHTNGVTHAIQIKDLDENKNLSVEFLRDKEGQGSLQVTNPSDDRKSPRVRIPLGDMSKLPHKFFEYTHFSPESKVTDVDIRTYNSEGTVKTDVAIRSEIDGRLLESDLYVIADKSAKYVFDPLW